MKPWVRAHPGASALVLGVVLVGVAVAVLGIDAALTPAGIITLTLPVIVAVGFYVGLRMLRGQPPN